MSVLHLEGQGRFGLEFLFFLPSRLLVNKLTASFLHGKTIVWRFGRWLLPSKADKKFYGYWDLDLEDLLLDYNQEKGMRQLEHIFFRLSL